MPIKVFINEGGYFSDASSALGLLGTEGWWHTVEAADLDGDGDIDFVLGNHGLNSDFKASPDKPVVMYVNDFDLNGRVEQIICRYQGDTLYPAVLKDDLVKQIPVLRQSFPKYTDYAGQTMEDIFQTEVLDRSVVLSAHILQSCIMFNEEGTSMHLEPLPREAQISPVFATLVDDLDGDGTADLLLGGNQSRAKPQTGIYAASYGLYMEGGGNGTFRSVPPGQSGISVRGDVRCLEILDLNGTRLLVVVRNNDILRFYKIMERI